MTTVRWIAGVIAALLAAGSLFGLGMAVAVESRIWSKRARAMRQMLWLIALFWFNLEVWGRVVYTLVHWNTGSG